MTIQIEHNGQGFRNNENAVLLATTARHHYIFVYNMKP
jgi:hypothetical protein